MADITDDVIRMAETIAVSGILAFSGYAIAATRLNRKQDKSRDIKLDKLVEYHEGIPADDFLGRPAVPGLNERLAKQEILNDTLTTNQRMIMSMIDTGNGKTIGQKVDNIEHIAQAAASAAQLASEQANELNQLVHDSLTLQEAHLNDGKVVMEIGVINDEHEWAALREHGIEMPDYVYPPDDLAFSLEDLKKRKKEGDS
jgi:hypothetical protein